MTENQTKQENNKYEYMSIDEIIKLLLDVRVGLTILKDSIDFEIIKEELKKAIDGIDIVGCELTQNIARKLKEK